MLAFGCVPFCVNGALDAEMFELRKLFMEVVIDLSLQPETHDGEEAARIWQGAFDRLNKAAYSLYHSKSPERPLHLGDLIVLEPEDGTLHTKPSQFEPAAGNAGAHIDALRNPASNESQCLGVGGLTTSAGAAKSPYDTASPPKPHTTPLNEFALPLKSLLTAPQPPESNSVTSAAENYSGLSPQPNLPQSPPIWGDSPALSADPPLPSSGDQGG